MVDAALPLLELFPDSKGLPSCLQDGQALAFTIGDSFDVVHSMCVKLSHLLGNLHLVSRQY